ncbi:hypothetical protein BHM03_00026432 [Ensete ventricosum]|nr:hypothetical protein BHM03_00026432 [Ensete ventricosum]
MGYSSSCLTKKILRFGIFPSWGLSQKLPRIIGINRAREVSYSGMPITAEMAEKWGLVNHVVDNGEVLKKAKEVAQAILRNNRDMVLRYKSVINDGSKMDLGHALALEKVRYKLFFVSHCHVLVVTKTSGESSQLLYWHDEGAICSYAEVYITSKFKARFEALAVSLPSM